VSTKTSAPVQGFNHNFQYQSRRYHVQTEDSGLPHAHYNTHLFLGGNIVASVKTSYAEKAREPELPKLVRALMEEQHKAMVKRLMAGDFNERLAQLSGSVHYEPGVLADGTNTASYVNTQAAAPGQASQLKPSSRPAVKPAAKPAAPPAQAKPAAKPAAPAGRPAPAQPVWQPSPPAASPRTPGQPLPATTRAPAQPTRPAAPPRMAPVAAPAAAKPAPAPTFFSETPLEMPADDLPTLFAEELISEKSLDEVILAFLSADLESPK